MSESQHNRDQCRQVREQLPEFVAGTLADDAGQLIAQHLAECSECAAELEVDPELRQRLDRGVVPASAPDGLADRIRAEIDLESRARSTSRFRSVLVAAAALFILLNVTSLVSKGILPHEFVLAELRIRASLEKIHEMLGVGLGDHLICTVYRRLADEPPSAETTVAEMGAAWAPLSDIATSYAPSGFEVRLAHRCKYRGREFVHLALHDGEQLMSLILTERLENDAFSSDDADTVAQLADIDLFGGSIDGFGVSAFETDDFLVYLVSDLSAADQAAAAAAYFPPVATFLATVAPPAATN